jgi:hypothetical protein
VEQFGPLRPLKTSVRSESLDSVGGSQSGPSSQSQASPTTGARHAATWLGASPPKERSIRSRPARGRRGLYNLPAKQVPPTVPLVFHWGKAIVLRLHRRRGGGTWKRGKDMRLSGRHRAFSFQIPPPDSGVVPFSEKPLPAIKTGIVLSGRRQFRLQMPSASVNPGNILPGDCTTRKYRRPCLRD